MARRAVHPRNPPLQGNGKHEKRHAKRRNPDHDMIDGRNALGPSIYPNSVSATSNSGIQNPSVVGGGYEAKVNEQRIHRIFEVSVLLTGAHALIECVGGLVLALASTASIVGWVNRLTQEELIGDQNDFVATRLLGMAQGFSISSKNFYAFYLLSHGIVKLALVVGLLRINLAYPVKPHSYYM